MTPEIVTLRDSEHMTPDFNDNDNPANWCVNPTPEGTPRQANPACP